MKVTPSKVGGLLKVVKEVIEFARSEDVQEVAAQIWRYLQREQGGDGGTTGSSDDPIAVSRALHRLYTRTPPRIALAGMTSSGKSSLLNTLFGVPIADVRRTPDTTDCVIHVPFRSGLTLYDTPGFAGNEQYENIARAFLSIPQDPALGEVDAVPLLRLHAERKSVEVAWINEQYPIDAVLLLVDLSRTLSRHDRTTIRNLVLELKQRYDSRLIVVGTHLDEVKKDPGPPLSANEGETVGGA